MNMSRALLYARTLRHLKPVQVYGRAQRALKSLGATRAGQRAEHAPAPPTRTARPLMTGARRPAVHGLYPEILQRIKK
jgi:hypothetical protein